MRNYKQILLFLGTCTLFWGCSQGFTPGRQNQDTVGDRKDVSVDQIDNGPASGHDVRLPEDLKNYSHDVPSSEGRQKDVQARYDSHDVQARYDSHDVQARYDSHDIQAPADFGYEVYGKDIRDTKDATGKSGFCLDDYDCPTERPYCYAGGNHECVECRDSNEDCPKGFACMSIYRAGDYSITADMRCMPKVCKNNADCAPYVCNRRTGQCVRCLTAADCPRSMECNSIGLYCKQRICNKESDCPKGLKCNKRAHCVECKTLVDCPDGLTCYPNGICDYPECDPTMPRRCINDINYVSCSASGNMVINGMCRVGTACADGYCKEW